MPLTGCDEGYDMSGSKMRLAQEFLFDHLGVPKELFDDGGRNCYYGNNYGHAELRGGGPFMRPTHASKFILKSAVESGVFNDSSLLYGYHAYGTPACNLKPILETQLNPSHSGAVGPGIYFSPFPLCAQL